MSEKSCNRSDLFSDRIVIRVQNTVYETFIDTLNRYPSTLLGSHEKRRQFYDPFAHELFLDRDAEAFDAILFYYQSFGMLTRPPWVPMEDFLEECEFFRIEKEDVRKLKEKEDYEDVSEIIEEVSEVEESKDRYTLLEQIWEFFEQPSSSKTASVYAILSFILIAASVVLSCSLTIPDTEKARNPDFFKDSWSLIELSLNVIFGLEYVLRLISSPRRLNFVISPLNVIELAAILPYFVVLTIDVRKISTLSFLRIIRIIRVLRLLRLSKQSTKVAATIKFLAESTKDMLTLVTCYLITAIVFGSIQYYSEAGVQDTLFTSIPESVWWALQTIIPLGYGDIVPTTVRGKVFAGIVAVVGSVTLTVPLLHIGGRYLNAHTD